MRALAILAYFVLFIAVGSFIVWFLNREEIMAWSIQEEKVKSVTLRESKIDRDLANSSWMNQSEEYDREWMQHANKEANEWFWIGCLIAGSLAVLLVYLLTH